ncbi:ABC transporter ATP-binding protein/permease [Bifidobacterium favimelis]|uniref:ABC transporter ATP-binding protein/permease n=1 Tax=Bifidobacterium favimelis TaxID=3122979 RepID=A0ABU8ZQ31_9BIFI
MIDKNLFRFAGIRRTMVLLALLSLLQGVSVTAQACGLTWALVRVWHLEGLGSLGLPVLTFFLAFAARQLCEVAKGKVSTGYADYVTRDLRPLLQAKVFRMGPSALAGRGTGSAVTVLIDGLDEVRTYVFTVLPKMMDMAFIPLMTLIVVWSQNALSGLVLILMLPLLFFFMAILGMAARDRSNRQYEQFRKLNTRFMDTVLGLPTLKMLGIDKEYEDEIYSVSERFRKRTMSVIRVAMTSTFALDFFTTLAVAIIAVFLGNDLINGSVRLFPALLSLILAPEYFLPIRQFGDDYHATLNGKNALNDIMTTLDAPEPARQDDLDWGGWGPESHLTVDQVGFTYEAPLPQEEASAGSQMDAIAKSSGGGKGKGESPDGDAGQAPSGPKALKDISFELTGYEKVAVVGRSGAGKSTLMNLLAGFNIMQTGSVDLDGHRLDHFNAPAWQRHISYIPQNPYIFNGTLADNVRFYDQDADEEAVREAVRAAGLDEWVATLPEGLNTGVGEGNRGISGGQAQRIALARVLLDRSREVLLFDEPTAHLDIETEYDLKKTLLPIMEDHLVIFATHRLHWLADVDWVIMLDGGRVVAQGRPDELIGRSGPLDDLIEEMGGNQIARYEQD